MSESRDTAVLFADIAGSTKLYEEAGDAAALQAIGRCLEALRAATEAGGGRVVKTIGDEIMALFGSADAAASAAAEMHSRLAQLPPAGGSPLAVRIGFHFGPVMQRDGDVFGDTVNLASRLVEQARRGQIITSRETMELLGPLFRRLTRRLYGIQVKGRASEVELCELLWSQDADMTQVSTEPLRPKTVVLRLRYRGNERALRRNPDSLTIGRDPQAAMVIADNMASRRHCTIERRQDKFVLADHSSNGTYVTVEGDAEILLRREELVLRRHGWIAFGQPRAGTEEIVEYFCD